MDGGVCSASNLDLLAGRGLDLVICLNPLSSGTELPADDGRPLRLGPLDPRDWLGTLSRQANGRRLAHEAGKVRRFGTEVLLIEPTAEDHAAMGRNLMSGRRRQQVIETATRTVREQLRRPEARDLLADLPAGRAAQDPPARRAALELAGAAAGARRAAKRPTARRSRPA